MKAFLDLLEKVLTWFFSLVFGALLIYLGLRWNNHRLDESDPWVQAHKKNTVEAYVEYLRTCQSCPHKAAAQKALDALHRGNGLIARLSDAHLPDLASINLPVFSPDARLILALGGRTPDVWDAETGKRDSHGSKTFSRRGKAVAVDALDFAPDGRRVGAGLAGDEGGRLMMWDLSTEALIGEHEVEGFDVKAVQFSPDGAWLGWRGDGPVGVWNPVSNRFLRGTHAEVGSIAFITTNGRVYLVSVAGRGLITWEPTSMEIVSEQTLESDRPLLGLSHDGEVIAYTDGRVLELWDTRSASLKASLRDLDGEITAFCRETATGNIVVGTRSGLVYLWDPRQVLPVGALSAHEGPVDALACGTGSRVVSIGWDGAKVWDLEKLKSQKQQDTETSRRF